MADDDLSELHHSIVIQDYENATAIIKKNPELLWSPRWKNARRTHPAILSVTYDMPSLFIFIVETVKKYAPDKLQEVLEWKDVRGVSLAATATRNLECLKVIVERSPIGNRILSDCSAAFAACRGGLVQCLDYIVKNGPHGIDVLKFVDEFGRNSAHLAANRSRLEILEYIRENSPDWYEIFERKDDDGNTPLHLAVRNGYKCAVYLVEHCFRSPRTIGFVNSKGQTAAHLAVKHLSERSLRCFVQRFSKKGAILEIPDSKGRTCAHYAALFDDEETLKYILRAAPGGISNLFLKDKKGFTPLTTKPKKTPDWKIDNNYIANYFTEGKIRQIGLENEIQVLKSNIEGGTLSSLVLEIIKITQESELRKLLKSQEN